MIPSIVFDKAFWQWVALAILVAAAWRRGAGPERACALSLVIMVLLDVLYHWLLDRSTSYRTVDVGHFVIDCITGAMLIAVALRANRIYPMFMAAWQLLGILSHIGRMSSSSAAALAYSIMAYTPSYLLMITLTIGLVAHVRRLRRFGPYRSWSNDVPPWRFA